MKYLLLFVLVFSFYGCEQDETDEEKAARLAKESLVDKHITYGGDGTLSSPYTIGNGSYGSDDTNDTYYNITLNGSCNVLLYEQMDSSSFLLFDTDYSSFDVNATNSGTLNDFKLHKTVPSGTYTIKNNVYDVTDSRLGVYGTCINDAYTFTPSTLITGLNFFTVDNQLYSFTLDSSSIVKINEIEDIYNFYIFDSNMDIIYSITDSTFEETLITGTYYLLIGSSVLNIENKATFYFSK